MKCPVPQQASDRKAEKYKHYVTMFWTDWWVAIWKVSEGSKANGKETK